MERLDAVGPTPVSDSLEHEILTAWTIVSSGEHLSLFVVADELTTIVWEIVCAMPERDIILVLVPCWIEAVCGAWNRT